MKKILTVYLLLLGFSAQSQILEVETSDLILKSVHSCADHFMEDTLILKKIPLKNIVIRPISISNNQDSLLFSMELNATPKDLQMLNLAGLKRTRYNRTLFIQESHLSNDFTGFEWITDKALIKQFVDSISAAAELSMFESQPIVVVCHVYDVTYKKNEDFQRNFNLDAEFYILRDYLPQEYTPIDNYSKEFDYSWNMRGAIFSYQFPFEFANILSFKRRINLLFRN